MKKLLLSFAAFAALAATANAQATRMSLYEEFTGEDCAPCSAANPVMWNLLKQAGNDGSKIQLLSFQEPIPYTGFLTQQQTAMNAARIGYYPAVTGTPTAVLDGVILPAAPNDYAGDPRGLTQANINTAQAVTSPFTITMTDAAYDATFTHVTVTINVTAAGAYAPASGNIKLRAALAESIHYSTAPGITGEGTETDFYNVVRAMYPDASGTSIAATWTVGQTYSLSATFPLNGVVDLNGHPFVVAWIQNDVDKSVAQAAKSNVIAPPAASADAGIDSVTTSIFGCGVAGGGVDVTNVLHNYGSTPLTAATIYTRVNTGLTGYGTWTTHAWTGNLAPGATTTVTYSVTGVPSTPNASGEFNRVFDSIAVAGDVNYGNNTSYGNALFQVTPAAFTEMRESFETGSLAGGWNDLGKVNGNGGITYGVVWSGSAANPLGHNGSKYALLLSELFQYNPGYTDYEMMPTYVKPTSGNSTLEFAYSYGQQETTNTDALDVVYSTDCSKTWTSIWHKAGTDLVTTTTAATPVTINAAGTAYVGLFIPASNSDWSYTSVDISSVPTDAIFAFATTTGGGNTLFVDDVQVTNNPLSVGNVTAAASTSLYPNPAKDNATLDLNLSVATHVTIDVVDAIGRTVAVIANQDMTAGFQKINISTASMATGIYNVRITTETGVTTQRLSVVK